VRRRDYGSKLFYLIDMSQHQATRPLHLMAATVQALINWEPRITVTRVDVLGGGMDGGVLESATILIPTGAVQ